MRLSAGVPAAFVDGLAAIRREFDVPGDFPVDVLAEADEIAGAPLPRSSHVDRTAVEFITLDPASSTDLDQAFAIEPAGGGDVVLHYAIADVAAFVRPGGAIDSEAWRRGVTIYLPDGRASLHPPVLAEGIASLLPDGDRLAVVFTVRVADDGGVRLDGVERAVIRSRAKLAYETVRPTDLPDGFAELARRIELAEAARGAERIEMPEQEVERTDTGYALRFRPRREVERQGAALSLATNMAVADLLFEAGTGLFRTMPRIDEGGVQRLRNTARAFGLDWPRDMALGVFEKSLAPDDLRTGAFQLAVRRASGKASYTPFTPGETPWHAAVAATYTHATAPLRRLVDRYVIESAVAVAAGRPVPTEYVDAFDGVAGVMDTATAKANRVDRAALDLAETVVLSGCEGQVFDAVVTDENDRGVRLQITEPAIVARVVAHRVDPGDEIRVKLVRADPATRTVEFERVG